MRAILILFAAFCLKSTISAESMWGGIQLPEFKVDPRWKAINVLSEIAVEAGSPLYVEFRKAENGEGNNWLEKPIAMDGSGVCSGNLSIALGQIQAKLMSKNRVGLEGLVIIAYSTDNDEMTKNILDLKFSGAPGDFIKYLESKFNFKRFIEKAGEVRDFHIGEFERWETVKKRSGKVEGKMSLRSALVAYLQAADLNAIVRVEKDGILDIDFTPVVSSCGWARVKYWRQLQAQEKRKNAFLRRRLDETISKDERELIEEILKESTKP